MAIASLAIVGVTVYGLFVAERLEDKSNRVREELTVAIGALDETTAALIATNEELSTSFLSTRGLGSEGSPVERAPEPGGDPAPDGTPSPVPIPTVPDGSAAEPAIDVIGGGYGPIEPAVVNSGVACNPTSANCRYLRFTMKDFAPGVYDLTCAHDGWGLFDASEFGGPYEVSVGEGGDLVAQDMSCFINFDRLTGQGVRVAVSGPKTLAADGTVSYEGDVFSEWTRDVIPLPPR